jgi:hypothetical protein
MYYMTHLAIHDDEKQWCMINFFSEKMCGGGGAWYRETEK